MRGIVLALSLVLLYACAQPPEIAPEDDENDIYRCYLNKDGTLLICAEKTKPTRMARD